MQDRRSPNQPFPPAKEDRGIFKTRAVDMRLTLAPMLRNSSRGDLVCIGYLDGAEIEVVFPGRRRSETGPLEAELARLVRDRKTGGGRTSLPIRASGVWRTRLMELDDIETKRVYQFLVAEWTLRSAVGIDTKFGQQPIK